MDNKKNLFKLKKTPYEKIDAMYIPTCRRDIVSRVKPT